MNQPAKAQEPSMEEILASIRRIISDDDTKKPAPEADKPAPSHAKLTQADLEATLAGVESAIVAKPPEHPAEDILDLTEAMTAKPAGEPAPVFHTIDGQPDVVFTEGEPALQDSQPVMEPPRQASRNAGEHPLLSSSATAAVDSAFNTLAQTVLVHNARTLDDLVREMIRPMLKAWLDDNLPSLVERLVRAEIDRVARGRG